MDNIMQTFLLGHDEYGNEKSMTIINGKGDIVAKEEYEIKFGGISSELMQTEFKHHYDKYYGTEK